MDAHSPEQQQKDFMSSFFHTETSNQNMEHHQSIYPYNPASSSHHPTAIQQSLQPTINNQINMDLLMHMQGIDNSSAVSPQSYSPHSLLEQQFKLTQLQQLQQLQNQIFQQQIALISGQTTGLLQNPSPTDTRQPSTQFNGLPTPGMRFSSCGSATSPIEVLASGPSGDLHPQPSMEYVSPMSLNSYVDQPQPQDYHNPNMDHTSTPIASQTVNSNYAPPRGSTSAPEHIAFRTSPLHRSLPSAADVDFDISPLTSPWLGANQQSMHTTSSSSNKRQASSSDDENGMQPSRKKQSPAIRPTNPSTQNKKLYRGSRSTNSTPLLRSTRSRKGSLAEAPGDTPSPVDLSMPPPAPPIPTNLAISSSSSSTSNTSQDTNLDPPPSPNFNTQLTPVTPASIMNLGRLGINSSLAPPSKQPIAPKPDPKSKAATKQSKAGCDTPSSSRTRTPRKTANSLVSPSLKAILPAGTTSSVGLTTTTTSLASSFPNMQGRKTSHKAAEQKRRDSLKTTFDDLRLLLPPIPLPTSDDRFTDEPILPGALPPRGPPKAGGEGPNKGVSKLQLLMCGNDYIRILKARVERRDEEIERLRREVRRLRVVCGGDGSTGGGSGSGGGMGMRMRMSMGTGMGGEEFDLERDLDAIEAFGPELGTGAAAALGMMSSGAAGDDEGDDDPGEG